MSSERLQQSRLRSSSVFLSTTSFVSQDRAIAAGFESSCERQNTALSNGSHRHIACRGELCVRPTVMMPRIPAACRASERLQRSAAAEGL